MSVCRRRDNELVAKILTLRLSSPKAERSAQKRTYFDSRQKLQSHDIQRVEVARMWEFAESPAYRTLLASARLWVPCVISAG